MQLSTKSRYGTRAVLDISIHGKDGPVTLNAISKRQNISKKYLGQIVNQLITAGILESVRGPQGGYLLAKTPKKLKLGEIIRTLDGSVAPVRCVDNPKLCRRTSKCVTREVWIQMKNSIDAVIDSVSISDLMKRQEEIDCL